MARVRGTNIRPAERLLRVPLGLLLVTGAVLLVPRVAMPSTGILAVLTLGVGLWLALTGLTGRCPLHAQLRWTDQSAQLEDEADVQDQQAEALRANPPFDMTVLNQVDPCNLGPSPMTRPTPEG